MPKLLPRVWILILKPLPVKPRPAPRPYEPPPLDPYPYQPPPGGGVAVRPGADDTNRHGLGEEAFNHVADVVCAIIDGTSDSDYTTTTMTVVDVHDIPAQGSTWRSISSCTATNTDVPHPYSCTHDAPINVTFAPQRICRFNLYGEGLPQWVSDVHKLCVAIISSMDDLVGHGRSPYRICLEIMFSLCHFCRQ